MEWPGSYDRPCFTHCNRAVVCERAFVGLCTQFHELLSHRAADMMMMMTTRGGGHEGNFPVVHSLFKRTD
jgi:hypothetical protein